MEPDPDVLAMVRRQLDRDPQPSTEALYGRAARINSDIYGLSLRQFNATYVLRVKRERKQAADEDAGRSGRDGSGSAGTGSGTGSGSGGGGRSGEGEGSDGEADGIEPRPGGFLDSLREAGSGRDEPEDGADREDGSGEDAPTAEASVADEPGAPGPGGPGLRERVRGVLLRYARQVVGPAGMAGAVAAVQAVDDRVDEILELAGARPCDGPAG